MKMQQKPGRGKRKFRRGYFFSVTKLGLANLAANFKFAAKYYTFILLDGSGFLNLRVTGSLEAPP